MIVYVYDMITNVKKQTLRDVSSVSSLNGRFLIDTPEAHVYIEKGEIKLVIYGF